MLTPLVKEDPCNYLLSVLYLDIGYFRQKSRQPNASSGSISYKTNSSYRKLLGCLQKLSCTRYLWHGCGFILIFKKLCIWLSDRMCVCTWYACDACGGQKRELNALDLELQMACEPPYVGCWESNLGLLKSSQCSQHWAISPAQECGLKSSSEV